MITLDDIGAPPLEDRGSSSLEGTQSLTKDLEILFQKYKIKSVFDAGARDAAWQWQTIAKIITYSAGEIDSKVVEYAKQTFPGLDICQFDITKDQFPNVDLLLVRDVTIHLDNTRKRKFINLWLSSNVPYLLVSHDPNESLNAEIDSTLPEIQYASVNWLLSPWNWPGPIYSIPDCGRTMSLWNQSQFKNINYEC